MFGLLQTKRRRDIAAAGTALYIQAVTASRQPFFYEQWQVTDTVDGRFDLIVLHLFLLIDRLQGFAGKDSVLLQQDLFDMLCADMDRNLREMGVGDMGIPRRVKAMMRAFNGRCNAYSEAMKNGTLSSTVMRNVYRERQTPFAVTLADYAKRQQAHLQRYSFDDFMAHRVEFADA